MTKSVGMEMAMTSSKVLSQNSSGGTEENYRNLGTVRFRTAAAIQYITTVCWFPPRKNEGSHWDTALPAAKLPLC
jgi:hypothetical protein